MINNNEEGTTLNEMKYIWSAQHIKTAFKKKKTNKQGQGLLEDIRPMVVSHLDVDHIKATLTTATTIAPLTTKVFRTQPGLLTVLRARFS